MTSAYADREPVTRREHDEPWVADLVTHERHGHPSSYLYEALSSMDRPVDLSDEEIEEKNVRLTCIGSPATDHVKLVSNAKHLDYLQNRVI